MKKTAIAFVLTFVMLFSVGTVFAFAGTPTDPASPDGSVLFEKDGVNVTTAGLDVDPTGEDSPIIRLEDAMDELQTHPKAESLAPASVQYAPQMWGIYENGGLTLEVQPEYNALITVKTPVNDMNGILFEVSETASLEVGGFDGAGWLFSIGKVSVEKLHEMLCYEMSGSRVIARDGNGGYYMLYHPTDVRYVRADTEEMIRDQAQWSMLCEWAGTVSDSFVEKNGLEPASFGNSEIDMAVARAAWMGSTAATLSTTEYGPVEIRGADGTPYAEFVLQSGFYEVDPGQTPDGEYVVLNFPEENLRLDFFRAPGSFVRIVSDDRETLYQAMIYDESVSIAEAMQGWYYAALEHAGHKGPDERLAPFFGDWVEKVAGRGRVRIIPSLAPGKVKIEASWPESAAVVDTWELTAVLTEDGKLVYENGLFVSAEYGEGGESREVDSDWSVSGEFILSNDELIWQDSRAEDGTFIRA